LTTDAKLLADVVTLARQAGDAILGVYGQQFEVTNKADHSPLTLADTKSHDIIVQGLQALTPQLPVLSEEASDIPYSERSQWQRYWLVDPLDGTKEFLNRTDEFTVNIAVVSQGRPSAGVVFAPALDELFAAPTAGAARKYAADGPVDLRIAQYDRTRPLRVIGSRSHASPAMQEWLDTLGIPYTFVAAGSSLKFCRIAEGRADVYPRFGHTSQWDTAAAQAVLERAGGSVSDFSGTPLCYGCDRPILNPFFAAIGDPCLARFIRK